MNNEEMTREEIHELGIKRKRVASRLIELHFMSNGREVSWLIDNQDNIPSNVYPFDEEKLYECFKEDDEGNVREIFQWWHITDSLAKELRKKNEPVLYVDDWDKWYWGRTCYGQALSLDWVLQEIAVEWFGLD